MALADYRKSSIFIRFLFAAIWDIRIVISPPMFFTYQALTKHNLVELHN